MQETHIDEGRSAVRKKRWRELLGGNQISKRVLLAICFFIILSWFLHFREVKMEVLEIGTLAPRYVISQTDFDFWDQEATQTLRQEAIRDIGAIYKVDENQVRSFRKNFENSLIEQQKWRLELPKTTFEEIYTLLDKIEEELFQTRYTDERTLSKMYALHISTAHFFALSPKEETLILPHAVWKKIGADLEQNSEYHVETIEFLTGAFAKQIWHLQEDLSLERSLRSTVQAEIADRYTHVEAGTQIIKKGEKVAPQHIAILQAMKKALDEDRNLWAPLTILGSALLALSLTIASLFYLHYFHRDLLKSLQKVTLLAAVIVMGLIFAKCTEHILLYEGKNLIEVIRFPLVIPFGALLICVLIGSEIAMVSSMFLLAVSGAALVVDNASFLLINFYAASATILFARKIHKRKEVFGVFGKVWLSLIPLIIGFNWSENNLWTFNFVTDLMSSFAFLLITAVLSIGLLPILEALFHVMTDMTLMEYMDPNHELLRRLSLEAPGTYQHCLVVGNIAEAAARAIGANGLFCRVSTLYHDIGKLFNPHYFTENQLGGFNIHQLLTPVESTHVIIAHVTEGETLARKYHLPQSFIDIIREHHGTTMVYYFYCKQVEQMGGDATKVNEKLFRYPGPRPRSKESAIIMIADTVEAASRSMEEVTEEEIFEMVDKLVAEKAKDGQFDECQLTFEELGQVKRAIVKALMVTRHLRIKYPEKHLF